MSLPAAPIRLIQFAGSGHCHRVRVFLSILGLPFVVETLDRHAGHHQSAAFLAKNPFGQVPVIEDGTVTLADSNAILVYLALRYDESRRWLPKEPAGAAQVQRWLSVAAGELANGPMTARRITRLKTDEDFGRAKAISDALFARLDGLLSHHDFLTGILPTIADVAIYSYVSLAPESGLSLTDFPHVRSWLHRFESLPGYIPV